MLLDTLTSRERQVALFELYGTEFRRLQEELPHVAAEIERAMRDRLDDAPSADEP